jgi:hypothetical protein
MLSSSRNRRAPRRLGLSRLAGCDQSEEYLVLPRSGPNGQPNTFFEKKPYLTVLDGQFRVVEQLALPMRTYAPYGYFVSPQGLGLVPSHRDYPRAEEGLLEVHWFRFAPAGK